MIEFLAALGIFLLSHSLPARTGLKARLVRSIGERAYLISYSLISVILLAWLIGAAVRAPRIPLWDKQLWHYHLALGLMLPASVLLVGGLLRPNPLSLSLSKRPFDASRPGLAGLTRHPVLWGFALWAGVHLVANGHLVALVLFGGFAIFSLAGMQIVDRRKQRELGIEWEQLDRARRGFGWTRAALLATFGGGILLYWILLWLHPRLLGPDPAAFLF
jgi:uncharacterized membrane protein